MLRLNDLPYDANAELTVSIPPMVLLIQWEQSSLHSRRLHALSEAETTHDC